ALHLSKSKLRIFAQSRAQLLSVLTPADVIAALLVQLFLAVHQPHKGLDTSVGSNDSGNERVLSIRQLDSDFERYRGAEHCVSDPVLYLHQSGIRVQKKVTR